MVNGLYPDQDQQFVRTAQGPNCLQQTTKVAAGKERAIKTKRIMNIQMKRGKGNHEMAYNRWTTLT